MAGSLCHWTWRCHQSDTGLIFEIIVGSLISFNNFDARLIAKLYINIKILYMFVLCVIYIYTYISISIFTRTVKFDIYHILSMIDRMMDFKRLLGFKDVHDFERQRNEVKKTYTFKWP